MLCFSALTLFSRYKDSLGSGHDSELTELSELTSPDHLHTSPLVTKYRYCIVCVHCHWLLIIRDSDTHMHTQTHTHVYLCVYVYICVMTHTHAHKNTLTRVLVCVYVYICVTTLLCFRKQKYSLRMSSVAFHLLVQFLQVKHMCTLHVDCTDSLSLYIYM